MRRAAAMRGLGLAASAWLLCCAAATAAAPGATPSAPVRHTPSADAVSSAALLASACSGCHRAGGEAIVDLHALSAPQIEQALLAYKRTAEGGTVMHRMARGYSDDEIAAIARQIGR